MIPVAVGMLLCVSFSAFMLHRNYANKKRCDLFLLATVIAPSAAWVCQLVANLLSRLRPLKMDEYIYCLSVVYGHHPSFVIGRFILHYVWLYNACVYSYNYLSFAVLGLFALYLWNKPSHKTVELIKTYAINLAIAPLMYLIVPACGPVYAFSSFPNQGPTITSPHLIPLSAAPNCVPSIHFSTALLILWFGRCWKPVKAAAIVYISLIVLATLGSGQHYLFDLVLAVPYTVAVILLGRYRKPDHTVVKAAITACQMKHQPTNP